MLKVALILLFSAVYINCESQNVPVFMWGPKASSILPSLKNVKSDEFAALVEVQHTPDTVTFVFIEPKLSVEDFSCKTEKSTTCFEHLQKIKERTYIPNVEVPIQTLETIFPVHKTVTLSNDGEKNQDVPMENGNTVFIYLHEAKNNKDLGSHDELISKIYQKAVDANKKVLAIFTGETPSFAYSQPLKRHIRDVSNKNWASDVESNQVTRFFPNTLIITMASLEIQKSATDIKTFEFKDLTVDAAANNKSSDGKSWVQVDVTIKGGTPSIDIKMSIVWNGGAWQLSQLNFDSKVYPIVDVWANYGLSYACNQLKIFHYKNEEVITLNGFQIQANFFDTQYFKQYGTANNCVGFFSAAIWGGLFVVLLLIGILMTGLTFIMDINTMDRFDDPKGKTITINAAE